MALLLGRLAGAAAHHWKRSALVLVAVLAVLGVLASTGTGFSDDFSTPGGVDALGGFSRAQVVFNALNLTSQVPSIIPLTDRLSTFAEAKPNRA